MNSSPTHLPNRDASSTSPSARGRSLLQAIVAGVDASLIAAVLGIMYSLIAYSALGPGALSFSMFATTIALVVGGVVALGAGRDWSMIFGPTASGALVTASMVRDLQGLAAARSSLEAAVVGALVVVVVSGVAQLILARLRIGSALKFVPYPVLMGFANSVALLLFISMIPAALGHSYSGRLAESATWFDGWRPAALLVAAIGTAAGRVMSRRLPRLPAAFAALVAATIAHYVIAATCDDCSLGPLLVIGTKAAARMPEVAGASVVLTLGPAYWGIVLQAALVLTVLNSLFSLLGAAQLLRAGEPPVDGNRLLRSLGTANFVSGMTLGLPVAVLASPTLAIRRGGSAPRVALAVYFVALAAIFAFGRRWFESLPMAAIASAVFTSSFGLFDPATGPLFRQACAGRKSLKASAGPIAVTTLVVAIGVSTGLAAALFIGSLAAVCLLAVEIRRSVVVAVDDARTRRSRRVRPVADAARLDRMGDQVRIIVLGHWLYFGTADELGDLLERQTSTRWLLLDVRGVAGVDVTAARSLIHAAGRLADRGMQLVVAGLPNDDARRHPIELFRGKDGTLPLTLMASLDEALERAEEDLLGSADDMSDDPGLTFPGMTADDASRLAPWMEAISIATGEVLFRAGDRGDAFFVLVRGRVTLSVARGTASRTRLLTFGAGGIFGELAVLDGCPRSADAVADTDCRLWMLTRDRLETMALEDPRLHTKVLQALAIQLSQRLRNTTKLLDLD